MTVSECISERDWGGSTALEGVGGGVIAVMVGDDGLEMLMMVVVALRGAG